MTRRCCVTTRYIFPCLKKIKNKNPKLHPDKNCIYQNKLSLYFLWGTFHHIFQNQQSLGFLSGALAQYVGQWIKKKKKRKGESCAVQHKQRHLIILLSDTCHTQHAIGPMFSLLGPSYPSGGYVTLEAKKFRQDKVQRSSKWSNHVWKT